jgi:polyphenol oxidase
VIDTHTAAGTVADAAVTTQRSVACTIMVADCLPVLFADAAGTVVAAAHAGWRGLAAGVLEAVFAEFLKQKQALAHTESASPAIKSVANTAHKKSFDAAAAPSEVTVWLGPCIGPTAFEVGAEVREAFMAQDAQAERYFRPQDSAQGKYLADLAGLARTRLRALGLTQITGNDGSAPWCTVTNESAFFSHRRDAARLGSSGRMAACIWLP